MPKPRKPSSAQTRAQGLGNQPNKLASGDNNQREIPQIKSIASLNQIDSTGPVMVVSGGEPTAEEIDKFGVQVYSLRNGAPDADFENYVAKLEERAARSDKLMFEEWKKSEEQRKAAWIAKQCDVRKMFPRRFPRSRSLEGVSHGHGDGELLQFRFTCDLPIDRLESLTTSASHMTNTLPFPLYHDHVLWNCQPRIRAVDGDKLEFYIDQFGPHLMFPPVPGREITTYFYEPPEVCAGLLVLTINGQRLKTVLLPNRGSKLIFERKFSIAELKKYQEPLIVMDLHLYVPRDFFKLLYTKELPPLIDEEHTVESILAGEEVIGVEWAIIVPESGHQLGSGNPAWTAYCVNKSVLETNCNSIIFESGTCGEYIQVVEGDGFILPRITPEHMEIVLRILYVVRIPLPLHGAADLAETIVALFKADFLANALAQQWEHLMIMESLAVDKTSGASYKHLFRLLSIIWRFPPGFILEAKRVAIGVFADMVHLNGGDDIDKFMDARMSEIRADPNVDSKHWEAIKNSIIKHLYMVSSVTKTGLAPPKPVPEHTKSDLENVKSKPKPEPEDTKPEPVNAKPEPEKTKSEPDNVKPEPEDVKSEPVNAKPKPVTAEPDEEEWHDEAVDNFNPRDIKCKCAIS